TRCWGGPGESGIRRCSTALQWRPTTYRARRSAWALTSLRPREAAVGVDVAGESEHLLGDDVPLDRERAAADRQRRREQDPVVPARIDVGELARTVVAEPVLRRSRLRPCGQRA